MCGSVNMYVCGNVCVVECLLVCVVVYTCVCVCTQCPLQSKIDCIFLPKKLSGSFGDPKNLTALDIQWLFWS